MQSNLWILTEERPKKEVIQKIIQKFLEDPIAEEILKGEIVEGDTMEVDYNKEMEQIVISRKAKGKKKKEEKKEE